MGPPQFHTPLSSTHQFHSKGPLLFSPQNPSVPHQNSSIQHTPQFYAETSSYQKPLGSTPKTPQFNTENQNILVWN